jgi:hypothetical protein
MHHTCCHDTAQRMRQSMAKRRTAGVMIKFTIGN